MSCNYFRFVGDVIVSHHANLSKMCKHWGSFLTHCIADGKIKLIYCPTDDMIADALTKALPSAKVKHFAKALGLSRN